MNLSLEQETLRKRCEHNWKGTESNKRARRGRELRMLPSSDLGHQTRGRQ